MAKVAKNKIIVLLGVLIALMPLVGFPRVWESFFQIVIGVAIVLFSIWATIDKKLTLKAKAQRRQAQKKQMVDMESQVLTEVPTETPPQGEPV
jgi:hypothetical protein